jgi:S1-C subfamily serine protease
MATVAAVIAGFVGVAIGSRLFSRTTASAPAAGPATQAPFIPFAPVNPSGRSGQGSAPSPQAQAVAGRVDSAVVDINTQLGYQSAAAAGTGMILTPDGKVLTNNHVIEGATQIKATVVTTHHTYTATVIGTDPTEDVAVIQLQGASGLTPIRIGDSSGVAAGDTVFAIGNAGGVGGTPSVTSGVVQATNQTITASDQGGTNPEQLSGLIETNAPMEPGDSGGPLAQSTGAVVGMDTAASGRTRFESSSTVGFAIPIARAVSIAGDITSGHATTSVHLGLPAFLGVQVYPAGSGSSSSGAQISRAEPNSPASAVGITSDDTIVSVGGQQVDSSTTLTNLLHRYRPGDRVVIGWLDPSGRAHRATVTLAAGPAD